MKKKGAVTLPGKAAKPPETREAFHFSAFLERHEIPFIWLLCAVACLRVAVFIAAFPLFNNVDELAHYDVVMKYARGHLPKGLEPFDLSASRTIILYGSPEYLHGVKIFPRGKVSPPLWSSPPGKVDGIVQQASAARARLPNFEASQPPVYYALAGVWYRLGQGLGLESGAGAYWIRYLNVLIYGLLVWLAYFFTKTLYPDNSFLRLAVPLVLAFFPQDVFYGMNNDVLSPLYFLGAFWCLIWWYSSETRGYALGALTGLLIAATFLVKLTNVAILGLLVVVLVLKISNLSRAGQWRREAPKMAVLGAAALLPIAAWCLRNYLVLGDLTGSVGKVAYMGWTRKPWGDIWSHPLFSFRGLSTFWHDLMASFWRGELTWYKERLASPGFDLYYALSSLVFLVAALIPVWRRTGNRRENLTGLLGFLAIGLSLAFLVSISLIFDFHGCHYPSRQYPYMTSGRLMLGPLVPFLVLYLLGFIYLLAKLRLAPFRLVILLIIVLLITASEIALSYQVFQSPYNLFHMLAGQT